MAYRLSVDRPVRQELLRILEKQLRTAATALRPGRQGVTRGAVHLGRRRVKKALTAIHLASATLTCSPRKTAFRLKRIKRVLAGVADGGAMISTVERLAKRAPGLSRGSVLVVLSRLELDERRLERSPAVRRAALQASGALTRTAAAVHQWRMRRSGFRSISTGLKKIYRRARRAMVIARRSPSDASYHEWRKRSKEYWLALRLLEARCGNGLSRDQQLAESLDEALGEYHNTALLIQFMISDHSGTREVRLRWLQALRAYRQDLRRQALQLGGRVYADRPGELLARTRLAWKSRHRELTVESRGRQPWRRAA